MSEYYSRKSIEISFTDGYRYRVEDAGDARIRITYLEPQPDGDWKQVGARFEFSADNVDALCNAMRDVEKSIY